MFKETDINNKNLSTSDVKVLISDDNKELNDILSKFLMLNNVNVVGLVYDGIKTLETIIKNKPDIVILDDFLPDLNCIEILQKLQDFYKTIGILPIMPFIIVTASNPRAEFKEKCLELGASHYITKPVDINFLLNLILSYSEEKSLYLKIKNEEKEIQKNKSENSETETVLTNKEDIFNISLTLEMLDKIDNSNDSFIFDTFSKVSLILAKIGLNPKNLGYRYLRDAIVIVIINPNKINYLTKDLYPSIATKYGRKSSSVERGIRHSIKSTWSNFQTPMRLELFGEYTNNSTPNCGTFIGVVSEYIRYNNNSID